MVFTPKGLHNAAQGRERSERTLGEGKPASTARHPFRSYRAGFLAPAQGALAALATLGFVVQPLRGKYHQHLDLRSFNGIAAKRSLAPPIRRRTLPDEQRRIREFPFWPLPASRHT